MTLELWVFWGMLGCLGLGYALGWWARRREMGEWKRAAMRWQAWYRLVAKQLERRANTWFAGVHYSQVLTELAAEAHTMPLDCAPGAWQDLALRFADTVTDAASDADAVERLIRETRSL